MISRIPLQKGLPAQCQTREDNGWGKKALKFSEIIFFVLFMSAVNVARFFSRAFRKIIGAVKYLCGTV